MRLGKSLWLGFALACGVFVASAQTDVDRSFTTVSKTCDGIRWSDRALRMYPSIASACQAVEERNGKTFVKFQGTVRQNVDRGEQLVINFKDGGEVTVRPPAETRLYIDGKPTKVADLRRGDQLTFYIAEDRLAAQFPETEAVTTRFVIVPLVTPGGGAQEQPERTAALPATAGWLPLLGLAGWMLLGIAAFLGLIARKSR